jgi:hypothetical protein
MIPDDDGDSGAPRGPYGPSTSISLGAASDE